MGMMVGARMTFYGLGAMVSHGVGGVTRDMTGDKPPLCFGRSFVPGGLLCHR
ncbi:MAG: hypothetical protein N2Z74_07625 [Syntrophales bacterium]|nr:hypothetical protein [Syntrophales bacterium]